MLKWQWLVPVCFHSRVIRANKKKKTQGRSRIMTRPAGRVTRCFKRSRVASGLVRRSFQISRVGSGRVRRPSKSHGSGRVMTREIRGMSRVDPPLPASVFSPNGGSDPRILPVDPTPKKHAVCFPKSLSCRHFFGIILVFKH